MRHDVPGRSSQDTSAITARISDRANQGECARLCLVFARSLACSRSLSLGGAKIESRIYSTRCCDQRELDRSVFPINYPVIFYSSRCYYACNGKLNELKINTAIVCARELTFSNCVQTTIYFPERSTHNNRCKHVAANEIVQ